MRLLAVPVFLFTAIAGWGQSSSFQKLKAAYPDDRGVFLKRSKTVTLSVKDDSLSASAAIAESVLFLKDHAQQSTAWRIYGSYFVQVEDLKAKVLLWDRGRYKELAMKDIAKKNDDDNSVFYDDSYYYPLSFPDGPAGNQVAWTYKETHRDVRFLPVFYFFGNLPQVKGSFIVKASKGVDLSWTVYNDPDSTIHFKRYDKGSFTYYEWTAENIAPFQGEDDSPKYSYYVPQVAYYVKSFMGKSGKHNVLSNLDDLYKGYVPTISGLDENPTADMESVVKGLTSPGDTEIDVVRKVFYWVQDHVRYIAFEDGMRGLVPHKPNYIFNARYGDCKDMASLIVGMLRIAGIPSYYTWIGTRDLPYKYSRMPTPLVDNHMIATYIDKDKRHYFLDATGNYTTVDFPSAMIQGKEALVAFGAAGYEICEVPEIAKERNRRQDSVWVRVDKGSIIGRGSASYAGYEKINASYAFDKATEDARRKNVTEWVKKGNNKFYLDSFRISSLHEKDIPLGLKYSFRIEDYVNALNNELYINLNLEKGNYNSYIAADRKVPRESEYKAEHDETYILDIPEGYTVGYLPPNAGFRSKTLGFEMTYSLVNKTIVLKRKLYNNLLMLTPDLFADWNESIRNLSKAYKETIILNKLPK